MIDFDLLRSLGLMLPARQQEQLVHYARLLLEWNQKMDLTNVPADELTLRHFADSLMPISLGLVLNGKSLVDVGSGAGFPGLPLAIVCPDSRVTLLESQRKRCTFLQAVIEELHLSRVQVVWGRAEDLGHGPLRENFDYAVARALAPLPVLAEYLLPFVRPGGQALCWKGPAVVDEQAQGQGAAKKLGGSLGPLVTLGLPGRESFIQVLDKQKKTLALYPRKAGTPAKSPLS